MKKILLSTLLIAASATLYTGCKKDSDATAPVLTLIGNNPMFVVANDEDFYNTDPGATSLDDKDGDLTSKIIVDYGDYSSDISKNKAGDYNINYTSSDKSGNTTTETRLLYVTHSGAQLGGLTFHALDTAYQAGNPNPSAIAYNVPFSVSSQKFRGLMSNFSNNIFGSDPVYFNMESNRVTIPSQTPNGSGSAFTISGSGTMSFNLVTNIYTMVVVYTIVETGQPTITAHATLTSI